MGSLEIQHKLKHFRRKKNSAQSHAQESRRAGLSSKTTPTPQDMYAMQHSLGNRAVSQWVQSSSNRQIAAQDVLSARGAGKELPTNLRREMEQNLRLDLSAVRLHTDDSADRLNRQFGASAFAVGKDIFFRQGFYKPQSRSGLKMLKHELAHVAQQRGKTASRLHLALGNDKHEREAENFSRNPGSATLTAAKPGVIQRTLFDKLLGGSHKPTLTPLGGGSANEVFKVDHGPGETAGYFKPETEKGSQASSKSVVSSTLDQMLGTQALSRETFAKYQGKKGGESFEVPGRSVSENEFNDRLPPEMAAEIDDETLKTMGQLFKRKSDGIYRSSGTRFMRHDYSHPETQRSLSNIQLQDAITGQQDRHGGNIKIDDSHVARGYDNDLVSLDPHNDEDSFDRTGLRDKRPANAAGRTAARIRALQAVNKQAGKKVGLPSHIDQATAQSVMGLKSRDMLAQLKARKAQGNLSDEQLSMLRDRYSAVRRYVKAGMAASGQVQDPAKRAKWGSAAYQAAVTSGAGKIPSIVGRGGWGAGTYAAQMGEHAQRDGEYPSYLKRSVENLTEASANPTQTGAYAEPLPPFMRAQPAGGIAGQRALLGQNRIPPRPTGEAPRPPLPAAPPLAPAPAEAPPAQAAIPSGNTRRLIDLYNR
ncbi:MAG: DUF4157 domain-containing protein [Anaerolineae bacterium]|nr:DUF4157 domain-containing protein [Anaerolineae bacterium]